MRILFDTNVLIDVLEARQPHAIMAAGLFGAVERGRLSGVVGATSVTTLHYLLRRSLGGPASDTAVALVLQLFDVAVVDRAVLTRALDGRWRDFEDAVLHEAARTDGVDGIVTRNRADFDAARIPVYSPAELGRMLDL